MHYIGRRVYILFRQRIHELCSDFIWKNKIKYSVNTKVKKINLNNILSLCTKSNRTRFIEITYFSVFKETRCNSLKLRYLEDKLDLRILHALPTAKWRRLRHWNGEYLLSVTFEIEQIESIEVFFFSVKSKQVFIQTYSLSIMKLLDKWLLRLKFQD